MSGRVLMDGAAEGAALLLTAPLSFWGGVDGATGRVIDPTHPGLGAVLAGRVLLMPCGRGSSSSSSVLAELLRSGNGPAAIVLERPDPILATGAIVAWELYGVVCPVVVVPVGARDAEWCDGDRLRVEAGADGAARVLRAG